MKISIGTPVAWFVSSAWMRADNRWVRELESAGCSPQRILAEGSLIDRGWNSCLSKAREFQPDWFVGVESDVFPTLSGSALLEYLETTREDAIVSPGLGVTGWMWRSLKPASMKSVRVGDRMLQDFSFWQGVRRAGARRIWADSKLGCWHRHATGNYNSAEGIAEAVFEGWMGLFAIRGAVLERLPVLFRIADLDYYCAQNDVRLPEGFIEADRLP